MVNIQETKFLETRVKLSLFASFFLEDPKKIKGSTSFLFNKINEPKFKKLIDKEDYSKVKKQKKYIRKRKVTRKEKEDIIQKYGYKYLFSNDHVPFPYFYENRGILILGTPGSGKTNGIQGMLSGTFGENGEKLTLGIYDFNEAMFIYVYKDFLTQKRPGIDIEIGSQNKGSSKINFVKALRDNYGRADKSMCEMYAKMGVQGKNGDGDHFTDQARIVGVALLADIAEIPGSDNKTMIDYVLRYTDNPRELRERLMESPTVQRMGIASRIAGALTIDKGGNLDPQGMSVFASINTFFSNLTREEFYYEEGENDFDMLQHMLTMNKDFIRKRVYIVNDPQSKNCDLYNALIFAQIFMFGKRLEQNTSDRVWFLFDECQTVAADGNEAIGRELLKEYTQFMAVSRSFGWAHINSTQSISRMEAILGKKENVKQYYQMFASKMFFQYNEPDDLNYMIKIFGEKTVKKSKESLSSDGELGHARLNETDDERDYKLVKPEEISDLDELSAYIKFGKYPGSIIKFEWFQPEKTYIPVPAKIPEFDLHIINRDFDDSIISLFKSRISSAFSKNSFRFTHEDYLKFLELEHETQQFFLQKLEDTEGVTKARIRQHLPYVNEIDTLNHYAEELSEEPIGENAQESILSELRKKSGLYVKSRLKEQFLENSDYTFLKGLKGFVLIKKAQIKEYTFEDFPDFEKKDFIKRLQDIKGELKSAMYKRNKYSTAEKLLVMEMNFIQDLLDSDVSLTTTINPGAEAAESKSERDSDIVPETEVKEEPKVEEVGSNQDLSEEEMAEIMAEHEEKPVVASTEDLMAKEMADLGITTATEVNPLD